MIAEVFDLDALRQAIEQSRGPAYLDKSQRTKVRRWSDEHRLVFSIDEVGIWKYICLACAFQHHADAITSVRT